MKIPSRKELAAQIDNLGASRFVRSLFEGTPFLFGGDDQRFANWKGNVAQAAGIEASGVWLVGSAAVGYSLSPTKPTRPFSRTSTAARNASDVDIALIDDALFQSLWNDLVKADIGRSLKLSYTARESVRRKVYFGAILVERIPPCSGTQRTLAARAEATREDPVRGLTANARVYRRFEDLIAYHEHSVRELRKELR